MTIKHAAVALAVVLGLAAAARADEAAPSPQLTLSASALDFGGAEAQALELSNHGAAPVSIHKVVVAPDARGFSVDDPGEHLLRAGETLKLAVRFVPDGKRAQAFGAVQVYSDDARFPPSADDRDSHVAGVALRYHASWLLTLIIFFPLVGAAFILMLPRGRHGIARALALATTLVPLAASIYLCARFDRGFGLTGGNGGVQFVQHVVWIPSFHIEYFVGVDGLSIAMVLLTALVSTIAVIASFGIERDVRAYFALFLLLETGMFGTFCALDFFLFYVFWELMLLPMYFLIGLWGGPRKEYAAIKFFLYTLAGSVLLLLGIIALYYHADPTTLVDGTPARHTFDMLKLAQANDFTHKALTLFGCDFTHVVWVAFFVGFAIKVPMFPFHTWLPDAHVEAPTAISVILAGVLLKMGIYGMMRVNFAILPEATQWAATTMAVFGAINIVYGALCAFAQKDLKRLVAYSSVSHMGYCLLGLAALTTTGFTGAIVQLFNHGTITAMLFLLVGVLYDRAHTREIDRFGGVASVMPRYAALFGFAFMASLGLPGLSGFIGELLVFLGAFPVHRTLTIAAAFAVVLTAAYHLWALQRVQLGPWNERWRDRAQFPDLTARELVTLLPLALLVLVLGFYPLPLLSLVQTGVTDLLAQVMR